MNNKGGYPRGRRHNPTKLALDDRFTKAYTIHLLNEEAKPILEYCITNDISFSEAVRQLVKKGLKNEKPTIRRPNPPAPRVWWW